MRGTLTRHSCRQCATGFSLTCLPSVDRIDRRHSHVAFCSTHFYIDYPGVFCILSSLPLFCSAPLTSPCLPSSCRAKSLHRLAAVTSRHTASPGQATAGPRHDRSTSGTLLLRESEILVFYHNASQRRLAGSSDQIAQDRRDFDI